MQLPQLLTKFHLVDLICLAHCLFSSQKHILILCLRNVLELCKLLSLWTLVGTLFRYRRYVTFIFFLQVVQIDRVKDKCTSSEIRATGEEVTP